MSSLYDAEFHSERSPFTGTADSRTQDSLEISTSQSGSGRVAPAVPALAVHSINSERARSESYEFVQPANEEDDNHDDSSDGEVAARIGRAPSTSSVRSRSPGREPNSREQVLSREVPRPTSVPRPSTAPRALSPADLATTDNYYGPCAARPGTPRTPRTGVPPRPSAGSPRGLLNPLQGNDDERRPQRYSIDTPRSAASTSPILNADERLERALRASHRDEDDSSSKRHRSSVGTRAFDTEHMNAKSIIKRLNDRIEHQDGTIQVQRSHNSRLSQQIVDQQNQSLAIECRAEQRLSLRENESLATIDNQESKIAGLQQTIQRLQSTAPQLLAEQSAIATATRERDLAMMEHNVAKDTIGMLQRQIVNKGDQTSIMDKNTTEIIQKLREELITERGRTSGIPLLREELHNAQVFGNVTDMALDSSEQKLRNEAEMAVRDYNNEKNLNQGLLIEANRCKVLLSREEKTAASSVLSLETCEQKQESVVAEHLVTKRDEAAFHYQYIEALQQMSELRKEENISVANLKSELAAVNLSMAVVEPKVMNEIQLYKDRSEHLESTAAEQRELAEQARAQMLVEAKAFMGQKALTLEMETQMNLQVQYNQASLASYGLKSMDDDDKLRTYRTELEDVKNQLVVLRDTVPARSESQSVEFAEERERMKENHEQLAEGCEEILLEALEARREVKRELGVQLELNRTLQQQLDNQISRDVSMLERDRAEVDERRSTMALKDRILDKMRNKLREDRDEGLPSGQLAARGIPGGPAVLSAMGSWQMPADSSRNNAPPPAPAGGSDLPRTPCQPPSGREDPPPPNPSPDGDGGGGNGHGRETGRATAPKRPAKPTEEERSSDEDIPKRKEGEIKIDKKFPDHATIQKWKQHVIHCVVAASAYTDEKEVDWLNYVMTLMEGLTLVEALQVLIDVPKKYRGLDHKLGYVLRRPEFLPTALARDVNKYEAEAQERGRVIKGQQILYMIIDYLKQTPNLGYFYAATALYKTMWGKLPYGDTVRGMKAYVDTLDMIRKRMNPAEVPGPESMRSIMMEQMDKSVVLKTEMDYFHRMETKPEGATVYTEKWLRNIIFEYVERQNRLENKEGHQKAFEDLAAGKVPEIYGTIAAKAAPVKKTRRTRKNRNAAPADGQPQQPQPQPSPPPATTNAQQPQQPTSAPGGPKKTPKDRKGKNKNKLAANPADPRSEQPCVFHHRGTNGCTLGKMCPYMHGDKMKKADAEKLQWPSRGGRRDSPAPGNRTSRSGSEASRTGSSRSDSRGSSASRSQTSGKGSSKGSQGSNRAKGKGKGKSKTGRTSQYRPCTDFIKTGKCTRSTIGNGKVQSCSKGLHVSADQLKMLRAAEGAAAARCAATVTANEAAPAADQ